MSVVSKQLRLLYGADLSHFQIDANSGVVRYVVLKRQLRLLENQQDFPSI
jgi:hypothetical protein